LFNKWDWPAVAADGLGILGGFFLLPWLTAQMRAQTTGNVLLLLLFFILFCTAVYLIRKLEPHGGPPIVPEAWLRPLPLRILAILFSAVLIVIILDQFTYWELIFIVDDRELGAGESSAFFVYGPGAWLGVTLFYVLVLSAGVRPTIARGTSRYQPLAALGLLLVNGMVVVGTAVFAATLTRWQFATPLIAVPLLLAAAAFWLPPRLWYLTKQPIPSTLLTFTLFIITTIIIQLTN
jgi:hypothetical protein